MKKWVGYRVVGIVRPGTQRGASPDDIELIEADICDHAAWSKLLSEHAPQEVYHLATCHHSTEDGVNPSDHQLKKEMVRTNFLSTKVLAFAVLESGCTCRVVYAGSSQMYSAETSYHEIDESADRKRMVVPEFPHRSRRHSGRHSRQRWRSNR